MEWPDWRRKFKFAITYNVFIASLSALYAERRCVYSLNTHTHERGDVFIPTVVRIVNFSLGFYWHQLDQWYCLKSITKIYILKLWGRFLSLSGNQSISIFLLKKLKPKMVIPINLEIKGVTWRIILLDNVLAKAERIWLTPIKFKSDC